MLARCANGFGAIALTALMSEKAFGGVVRDKARFETFKAEWIDACPDREAYLAHHAEVFGKDALARIAATAGPVADGGFAYTHAPELRFR